MKIVVFQKLLKLVTREFVDTDNSNLANKGM